MSDYSAENKDAPVNYDDAGHMQTTDTVACSDDDMPGPGLDIGAKIHLQLCAIDDKLAQNQQDAASKEQARLASLPNRYALPTLADVSSSAWRLFKFGGPQTGRQWHVRCVAAIDATGTTGMTGAYVFIGSPGGIAVDPATGPTSATWSALRDSLPVRGQAAADQYGVGSLFARYGELVYVVVKPGTATDVILATLEIEDEPMDALPVQAVTHE